MRTCALTVTCLVLALGEPAVAQPSATKADPAANAAIKYWQAFGLLPALDKDQEGIVNEWDKAPINAAALKIIEQSRNSLEYLHRGAKLAQCDWGLEYKDGINMLIPHLAKVRTLANLAALRARHEFERGNAKAGWDDVRAILMLARHVETDPIMISQVVGYGAEGIAIQAAASHLQDSKPSLADAAVVLDLLPANPTYTQMLQVEKQTSAEWLIQELLIAEKNKPGSWRKAWNDLLGGPNEGGTETSKAPAVKSLDEAVKLLEGLPPLYDEVARLTELPWPEFDARYSQFIQKVRASNAAAAAIFPAMERVVAGKRRADARIALLKAAVAVAQGGPDRLKDIQDPFGDGPFEYKAVDGGFELKSKLTFKEQPVTLAVRKR